MTIESPGNLFPIDSDDSNKLYDDDDGSSLYASAGDLESDDESGGMSLAMESEMSPSMDMNDDESYKDNTILEIIPSDRIDVVMDTNTKETTTLYVKKALGGNRTLFDYGFSGRHDKALDSEQPQGRKRKLDNVDSDSYSSQVPVEAVLPKVPGQSKSSIHARERRKALNDGTLTVDPHAREVWKSKIRKLDSLVEFDDKNPRSTRHSGCGEYIKMKDIGDTTRFKEHMKTCLSRKSRAAGETRSLLVCGFGKGDKAEVASYKPQDKEGEDLQKATSRTVPCPGLTEADDSRISSYLLRTSARSAGGRRITDIAQEQYGRYFRKLTVEEKVAVEDMQQAGHTWMNDHRRRRVFAVKCNYP